VVIHLEANRTSHLVVSHAAYQSVSVSEVLDELKQNDGELIFATYSTFLYQ
jgi:hypothetical protein